MKDKKQEDDERNEEFEMNMIREQGIKGLTQAEFKFQGNLQNRGCFSCLLPKVQMQINTEVDRVLFYPDEKVKVKMTIDNRRSERKIQSINIFLR